TGRIDTATRKRFLGQIHHSGQHLLQLINDILDLSKVEAGQMELHREPVNVAEISRAAIDTVEQIARTRMVTVELHSDADLEVVADAGKLKQMLLNLLSNAVKFTGAGGRVSVTARRTHSLVEIEVSDNGIGIAPADLARLFSEFQQLEQRKGGPHEGTGLGLALTRRLAQLHGGDVTVESEEGKGSTFTIRLPAQSVGPATTGKPLVLVVEDNPAAAEILGRHLESGGFGMKVA